MLFFIGVVLADIEVLGAFKYILNLKILYRYLIAIFFLGIFFMGDFRKDYRDEKTHFVQAVSLFIFTMISKEFQYILETRLFQFWAQISFTFYLSHVLFLLPARFFKFYLINNHDWTPGNSEAVSTILFLMFCVPFSYIMEIYFDSPSRLFSNSLFKIMEKKKE